MKPQPLKLVIEHYRRLRDDSVAAQSRVQAELAAAHRTLHVLEQYRREQHQRARDSGKNPVSTTHLLLQTRFSGKLDEAIDLQSQRIAEVQHRIDHFRAQVLADQQRFKALETIVKQRTARAQQKAARADQMATDERAANAHSQDMRSAAEHLAQHSAHSH